MTPLPLRRVLADSPLVARLNLLTLAALVVAVTALLWPNWRENPDLSHGYFMLPVFVYLLLESRSGTPRWLPAGAASMVPVCGLLGLGVIALFGSGLYAAALGWSHALIAFTLTFAVVCFLGAGLVTLGTERIRVFPLNWCSITALGLWLLSAPIPPGSYTRLTLGLQLAVTENVLRTLHLLGIAAVRHGNIIDLASATVGVEEACSGVRSLVSCLFAGLIFSAALVKRTSSRLWLIALAAPLAIAMNFLRSLALTLLANAGIDIAGTWHDATGFAVLGITAILLGAFALLLERRELRAARAGVAPVEPPRGDTITPTPAAPVTARISPPHAALATGFTLAAIVVALFVHHTRPAVRPGTPVPNLAAVLPARMPGWEVRTSTDLYQFSSTLKTEFLVQRTYLRPTAQGVEQITIYLAYWRAGQASVSLVSSHTPDACWPGSGWALEPLPQTQARLTVSDRTLAPAEARLFKAGDYPQYVWFWHLYDGRPIAFQDPYSASALLKIAWQYGFTHEGDQLFVRISSNRPWSDFAQEPLLAEVFKRLQFLGL